MLYDYRRCDSRTAANPRHCQHTPLAHDASNRTITQTRRCFTHIITGSQQ